MMRFFTRHAFIASLMALLSTTASSAQTLNLTQTGLIEGGNGVVPNLTGASSVFVAGNYAYVVGIGDVMEILDITVPGVPLHKSTLANSVGGASILRPQAIVVSGNYAYITSYGANALEIVDVSDPSMPVHKGSLYDGGGKAPFLNQGWGLSVVGNYAYIASYGSNALEIVDISHPAAPVHKGSLQDGGGKAPFLSGPLSVKVVGNYAYVGTNGSFEVVDVSNPAAPVHVGSLLDGHGVAPFLVQAQSIEVVGNYAYVTDAGTGAFNIIDVTNPASPLLKGNLINAQGTAPYLFAPFTVAVSGHNAYVGNLSTVGIAGQGRVGALEVIDISNPSAPVHQSALLHPLLANARSLFIADTKLYVTSRPNNSLSIVDISNPSSLGFISTAKSGTGGAILNGASSVYVSGNYAYVASYNGNALEIINVANPSMPVHAGSLSDGVGGATLYTAASVMVSGSYAYVASSLGAALEVVDVSIPTSPRHAGKVTLAMSNMIFYPNAVYVNQNYAYLVASPIPNAVLPPGVPNGNALFIVDVTNPSIPIIVGTLLDGAPGVVMKNPESVFVSGTNAYITTDNSLEIVDVSNPAVPVHKSSLVDGAGGASITLGNGVYVSGNVAYVASSVGLEIVNISNPAQPVHLSKVMDGGGVAPFVRQATSVFVAGQYAFVTSYGNQALEVIDVSNPALPTHQGSIRNGTAGALLDGPYSVAVSGNYAYVANGNLSQDLDVVYLFGPGVTSFSPTVGSAGTTVTITGENFNTFVSASINGVPAKVTSVTATTLTVAVPANATIGKIVVDYVGQKASNTTNFIVTPTALAPTQLSTSGFMAQWSNVGANGYFLDVSTDHFATFASGYANIALGSANQYLVTGLQPATRYQYRVRSSDGITVSPNSNTIGTLTIPAAPIATAADALSESGFTAHWSMVSGADGYYFDLSLDSTFSKSLISGYNGLALAGGTNTSEVVTGLSPFTTYYYRVRSYDSAGTSAASATIHVFTPDHMPPVIAPSTSNAAVLAFGDTQILAASMQDNVHVDTARFFYKGISRHSFNSIILHSTDGNYSVTVQSSWLDSLGLEYYFQAIDEAGNIATSPVSYAQVNYPSIILPPLPSGTAQKDYRIVTFPYQLSQENLSAFYLAAPWNDNTKVSIWWWDPTLNNGGRNYTRFGSGSTNAFDPGKGYWVLVRNPVAPQLTNVTAPNYTRSNLYSMTLKPGWNEIGNPYPVSIAWSDVIAFNEKTNPGANIGALILYDGTGYVTASGSRLLNPFEGGFVRNLGPTDIVLKIPFQGQTTTGGRLESVGTDLSQDAWSVFLHILQGDRRNELGGIGMHPLATDGIDRFDIFNPPAFMDDPHVDFFNAPDTHVAYSNDVVSPQRDYTWQFTPSGNVGAPARLTWNANISATTKQLLLFDEDLLLVTDMTTTDRYEFTLRQNSHFRIYFGDDVWQKIATDQIAAGAPYPNPLSGNAAKLNVALPTNDGQYQVRMVLYNAQGDQIETTSCVLPSGLHTVDLLANTSSDLPIPQGIYLYTLSISSGRSSAVFTGKIIKL